MATVSDTNGGTPSSPAPASQIPTSGPVTWWETYELLIGKGFSTVQALGIMANAINESNGNPEAVGDNGTSFGFVQFHSPGYNTNGLVTGNPQTDIRTQINYLAQVVSTQAVAGSTAAEVAGNFAAHFEECVGCQPGGAQYNSRVANAATVLGWFTSGNWPSSAGTGPGSSSPGSSAADPACILQFPGILGVGSFCMFRSSWARALIGGTLMAAAVPVGLVGAVVLAAFGFRQTGAGRAVGRTAEAVGGAVALFPGAEGAGAAVAAAGSAEARHAQAAKRQRDQRAQERHDESEYKKVAARRRDSAAGPALRDNERLDPVPF